MSRTRSGLVKGPLALAMLLSLGCGGTATEPSDGGAAQRPVGLARDSSELLRPALSGVRLDMTLTELVRQRPRLKREPAADREGLLAYEDVLGERRRGLFFYSPDLRHLERVQIAEQLASDSAVVQRVMDAQQRLGAAHGVWDCPSVEGQVPTRRYSYVRGTAAAIDVFALLGNRALATYYVTPRTQLRAALQLARCQPVRPENATRFPAVPSRTP